MIAPWKKNYKLAQSSILHIFISVSSPFASLSIVANATPPISPAAINDANKYLMLFSFVVPGIAIAPVDFTHARATWAVVHDFS